jgi:hypothetical protein
MIQSLALILSTLAFASSEDAFVNTYDIMIPNPGCVQTVVIARNSSGSLYLNENGNGSMCTFDKLNQPESKKFEDCPSAAMPIPGCVLKTVQSASIEGNKMVSSIEQATTVWGFTKTKWIRKCEVTLDGGQLTYKREEVRSKGAFGGNVEDNTCVYGVRE